MELEGLLRSVAGVLDRVRATSASAACEDRGRPTRRPPLLLLLLAAPRLAQIAGTSSECGEVGLPLPLRLLALRASLPVDRARPPPLLHHTPTHM